MHRKKFENEATALLQDVYRFLCHLCGDPRSAEDLTQETFLRAFRYHRFHEKA